MYLKQIELLGFKSFPKKTSIRFAEGVTAIVGPNGCGKTNVLDALRWVLGEQKPSMLRSSKMEEIIFNGTRDLKPLGMAEVTLTIINDKGILPTEYYELQITRRLFRSGESEYLINKVPCRLKDITDLFVDTGMGPHSYSVIQQHMIDAVISDKAEERRFLFEEAAGITKYKQRRKAALRKLEITEHDFLRLKDIYAEVKTRVNSLYRQHKKAERYQKLTQQVKEWEIYLDSTRIKKLTDEKRTLKGEFESLSDKKSSHSTTLNTAYAGIERDRQELIGLERQITEMNIKVADLTEEAHRVEQDISILNEKRSNSTKLIEKNKEEILKLKKRSDEMNSKTTEASLELSHLKTEMLEISSKLEAAQAIQVDADQKLLTSRFSREEKNRQLVSLEGMVSSGKTEKHNLSEQIEELTVKITSIEHQIATKKPLQSENLSQTEKLHFQMDELQTHKKSSETKREKLTTRTNELTETGEELAVELSSLIASKEACQARRNLLEEMIVHYEGYESGIVSVLESREKWKAVAGTVADLFVPVEGMESALDSALGNMAKFLVCYERSEAEAIIEQLRSENRGKVGILVPQSGTISPTVKRPELTIDGVVGWLDSYVSTDERLRHLMEAVLSRIVVFQPGTDISQLLEHLPYGFSAVSTDGTLYGSNLILGGADDAFGLFRRKEKLIEQENQIKGLSSKVDDAKSGRNKNIAELATVRAEQTQLLTTIETLTEEINSLQKLLSEAEFEQRSFVSDIDRLSREKQDLTQRLDNIRGRQYTLGLDSDDLVGKRQKLLECLEQSSNQLQQMETEATSAAQALSILQVKAIESRSSVEQTENQIRHIDELHNEITNNIARKNAEIDQAESDIITFNQTVSELEASLKLLFEKREIDTSSQSKLISTQTELKSKANQAEENAKKLRSDKDTTAEKLHEVDIRLTTIESEISSITERFRLDYDINILDAEAVCPDEEVTIEDVPNLVQTLKEKLKGFGAVNLLALEEYDVANEREKFLSEQLSDLTTAKNDLKSTINKINQTAKNLFYDTFEKVQQNFSDVFVNIFAGGDAKIRLIDPDDPLESDIEIVARPGGKKLLPITALSGGERALTAISLLFSLYLVKPSPFCILDEIDAPLDDANCHRFLEIIRSFSTSTQFITITHNKITMEASDNLYGVTMERPGVSQLVSVKFASKEESEEFGGIKLKHAEDTETETFEEILKTVNKSVSDVDESDTKPCQQLKDDSSIPESVGERLSEKVTIISDNES